MHPNEAPIRRTFEAFDRRDVAGIQAYLHPDIVWFDLGSDNPLGSEFRGVGEVLSFFAHTFETTNDSLHLNVHDVLANDNHAVALVQLTGQRGKRELNDQTVFLCHVKDGLVTQVWSYAEDQTKANAFWA